MIKYIIEQDEIDVKTYLKKHIGISSKALTKLKVSGIFVNSEPVFVTKVMKKNDVLEINPEYQKQTNYVAENIDLDIIHDDENFVVINKPAFMTVYPAGEHLTGSILNGYAYEFPDKIFRPIYRLDRNTSGIICIAKNKIASVSVIKKEYLAVVHGKTPQHGIIDTPIGLQPDSRIKRETGHGQEAKTEFFTINQTTEYSLVKVIIYTGRTHQIRVHMASIGFPLAGDDLYGGKMTLISHHALHCHKIKIENKALGVNLEFTQKLPNDIETAFSCIIKE